LNSPNAELWPPKGEAVLPNGLLLPNAEEDWPKAWVDPKLNAGVLEAPKAGVLAAPNGVLELPKADVLDEPNIGLLEAPKAPPPPNTGALDTPNALPVLPKVGLEVEPKAGVLVAPNAGLLVAPNAGVLVAPNAGVLEAPNAGVLEAPNAGVLVAPNAGVLVAPNAGVLVAPNAGWDDPPKGVEEPNMLLPKAGCDCCVAPNGLVWVGVDPKPPKAGFWPKTDDPINQENQFSNWTTKLSR